nr:hypothetical protein [uncultured Sellimonas sp.]
MFHVFEKLLKKQGYQMEFVVDSNSRNYYEEVPNLFMYGNFHSRKIEER